MGVYMKTDMVLLRKVAPELRTPKPILPETS
jgi:hypothetical protein